MASLLPALTPGVPCAAQVPQLSYAVCLCMQKFSMHEKSIRPEIYTCSAATREVSVYLHVLHLHFKPKVMINI